MKFFGIENNNDAQIEFFKNLLLNFDNSYFSNFIKLKAQQTRENANEQVVIEEDVIEFLEYMGIEPTEDNLVKFYNNDAMHKQFEQYLKQRKENDGYNALLSAIMNREDEEYER